MNTINPVIDTPDTPLHPAPIPYPPISPISSSQYPLSPHIHIPLSPIPISHGPKVSPHPLTLTPGASQCLTGDQEVSDYLLPVFTFPCSDHNTHSRPHTPGLGLTISLVHRA